MEKEGSFSQHEIEESPPLSGEDTICTSAEEQQRLLKLFQLLIEIDQNLKKKHEDNK